MNEKPVWIDSNSNFQFPDPANALTDPDGLLAMGGDLSTARIISAYLQGIFPWFSPGQPILWWSPDPRAVLFPEKIRISKSLQKTLNKKVFKVTFDQSFEEVIYHCATTPRKGQNGTWITDEMQQAYINLYKAGFAHSVECWSAGKLVGGLYGLALGKVFFGESMFSLQTDASKVAFATLVDELKKSDYALVDCQVSSDHLQSLGAEEIPRNRFLQLIKQYSCVSAPGRHWLNPDLRETDINTT